MNAFQLALLSQLWDEVTKTAVLHEKGLAGYKVAAV